MRSSNWIVKRFRAAFQFRIGTVRLEVVRLNGKKFETRRHAMDEVIDWMTFYNRRRIHATLGCAGPMQLEKSWHGAQLLKAA